MPQSLKIALAVALGVAFLVYLLYSSMGLSQVTCEVCMQFGGRIDCRSASGTTEQAATQTAIGNACALLTSGRDDNISCMARTPERVTCSP